ncbi:hypothetical protein CRENBAI_002718 [Crenichthys baileyi]|uniref:Uncharacterized protein n=1 Tax=Crenichthys baileyi TaxID=28760 RepID=A0AAV9RNZ7_9TELE
MSRFKSCVEMKSLPWVFCNRKIVLQSNTVGFHMEPYSSGQVSAENRGLRSVEARSSKIRRERGASNKASRPSLDIEPADEEGGRGVGVGAAAAGDADGGGGGWC